ncbi:caprin-1 isoform X6 [Petromyzon marinus]|uniref:Caprin-1-like isoform X6 n=1 Tax=Petromyzon marinus TaxID=7757 RepID=A0AAJ7TDN0_PETMA|nr:caprin-1-like isoform X6 [Petromyzon marinus]
MEARRAVRMRGAMRRSTVAEAVAAPRGASQLPRQPPEDPALRAMWEQSVTIVQHKIRNLEKKKSKLDDYKAKLNDGHALNQDQQEAVAKYMEVVSSLEFARDLLKTFASLNQDVQKVQKKAARREHLLREEAEQKRLRLVLEVQYILDSLGDGEAARLDFLAGQNGAALLLTQEMAYLDDLYKLVNPERVETTSFETQMEQASQHLWDLVEGKDKPVAGTTYKIIKEVIDRVRECSYFDNIHTPQNGLQEAPSEEQDLASSPESEKEEKEIPLPPEPQPQPQLQQLQQQVPEIEPEPIEEFENVCEVQPREQRPMPVTEPSPVVEAQVVPPAPAPAPQDPVLRQQHVQDLMARIQGTFDFMQDSLLDYEPPVDPAIVAAQPMAPVELLEGSTMASAVDNRVNQSDIPQQSSNQMPLLSAAQLLPAPSSLLQSNPVPSLAVLATDAGATEQLGQIPMVCTAVSDAYVPAQPLYQSAPHIPDALPQQPTIDPTQCLPLASEQIPVAGKPLSSGGINVNAAPFQSMQTVFNVNAPLPPETEVIKQQLPPSQPPYSTASYSTQPQTHQLSQPGALAQLTLETDAFQTVVSSSYQAPQETLSTSAGQPQGGVGGGGGFSRQAQTFYNSRGMPRGTARGMRSSTNGYRASNNYRGARGGPFNGANYEGFHVGYPGSANNYGQNSFAPRNYSMGFHQQEGGYQTGYKRGGTGPAGPRGAPRGGGRGTSPLMKSRFKSPMTGSMTAQSVE